MIPRGVPFSQETCQDLQKHWLWELPGNQGAKGAANYVPPASPGYPTYEDVEMKPALSLNCMYTVQKTQIGYDYMTASPVMYYRDGCYCESRWINGCPFHLHLSPSYQYFGFDSMSERIISDGAGSYSPNALCWYWSTPTHPEWGYLPGAAGTAAGVSYQGPERNDTDLRKAWNAARAARAEK